MTSSRKQWKEICGYDEKLSGKTLAGICSGIQCVIGQLIRGDPEEGGLVLALLPVWTVTYKGKDGKIYYYSNERQTGKVFGELPVDYGKVTLTGIISAVVVLIIALIGGYFL